MDPAVGAARSLRVLPVIARTRWAPARGRTRNACNTWATKPHGQTRGRAPANANRMPNGHPETPSALKRPRTAGDRRAGRVQKLPPATTRSSCYSATAR
eukprot:5319389-Lingulodinium_polyedra.AAC.1